MVPVVAVIQDGITGTVREGDARGDLLQGLTEQLLSGSAVVMLPELLAGPGEQVLGARA